MVRCDHEEIRQLANAVPLGPWTVQPAPGHPPRFHVVGPDGRPLLSALKKPVADFAAAACTLAVELVDDVQAAHRDLAKERHRADELEREAENIKEESGFDEADRERRKYRDAIDEAIDTLRSGDGAMPMLSMAAVRRLEAAVDGKPKTPPGAIDEPVVPMNPKSAQAVVAKLSAGCVAIWRKLVELPDALPWLDVEVGTNGQKAADKLVALGYAHLAGPHEVDQRHGMVTFRLSALGRAVRDAKATVSKLAASAAAEGGA